MMYPIPYAFDEDKIQKRDREYLQSMYPATAKKIFPYIQEECDRQEYEGSMIYDEYPDKLQLCLMCRRAYEQVMKQEKWEKETYTPEQIRMTASGADPNLYPNVNWFDELFTKYSSNSQVSVNVRGGG